MTGEQHEHSAVGGVGQVGYYLHDGGAMRRLILTGLRQIVGHAENALRRVVERRGEDLAHGDGRCLTAESEPRLEETELPSRRERRARQHDRTNSIEEQLTQDGGEIQGYGKEADV